MPPSPTPPLDSAGLYAACGSQDMAERADAYRALWPYLYRVALSLTRQQPEGEALAKECAQRALLRIYEKYEACEEPGAFLAWSRRIVSNLAIDELRRLKRLQPLTAADAYHPAADNAAPTDRSPAETVVTNKLTARALRQLLEQAPISSRSRRVVIGRYLDEADDETLAQAESDLSSQEVHPSHIQVTRAKNIAKLRQWELLKTFLAEELPSTITEGKVHPS